jgi:hypothetical protein
VSIVKEANILTGPKSQRTSKIPIVKGNKEEKMKERKKKRKM